MSSKAKDITLAKTDVFVVVAPSGTGKTTLNLRLIKEHSDKIEMSVSHTTRDRRPQEVDGVHYHFVDEQAFQKLADQKLLLEWANVFGNLYGTSLTEIERIRGKHKKLLLEIDVQGWHYARKRIQNACSIFVLPPTVKEIWRRLEGRGTDSLEVRLKRIETARSELEAAEEYDYFIVNDDLETAFKELVGVTIAANPELRFSRQQGLDHVKGLLEEFANAHWLEELKNK